LNDSTKTEQAKPFEATFTMINLLRPDYFQVVYAGVLILLLGPFRMGQIILLFIAALGGFIVGIGLFFALVADMSELLQRIGRDLIRLFRRYVKSPSRAPDETLD
jgi:hypothetical protein